MEIFCLLSEINSKKTAIFMEPFKSFASWVVSYDDLDFFKRGFDSRSFSSFIEVVFCHVYNCFKKTLAYGTFITWWVDNIDTRYQGC